MRSTSGRRSRLLALTAVSIATLTQRAWSAIQYWDADGATTGAGGATPAGTWGVDDFWSADAGGSAATSAWVAGNTAVFAAGTDATGAYAVTVSGTQDVGGIQFEEGTVALSGGTVNLTGNSVVLAAAGVANSSTIDSVISGNVGLNLTRVGTSGSVALTLGGDNTYSGVTTVAMGPSGQLTLNHNNALGGGGAGNGTTFSTGSSTAFIALPGDRIIAEDVEVRGGAVFGLQGGQVRSTAGVNTWAGNILINGSQNTSGSGLASVGSGSGTLVVTGVISSVNTGANTAGVAWAVSGPGTVVLRSSNTNVGFTRIFNGILEVQSDGALGTPSIDGKFDASTLFTPQSSSGGPTFPMLAFRAPPASPGFSYNTYEIISVAAQVASLGGSGLGINGNSLIDNFGGDNTFSGTIRLGGTVLTGPSRVVTSLGAVTGSSLELSGRLFASTSAVGTAATTPEQREIHKLGGGNLIISGVNDTTDGITSGDSDQYRLHGNFIIDAGTVTLRSTNPAGGALLGNSVGPMNFRVNAGTTLALDNTLAVNNNRIESVQLAGGELKLTGNDSASVIEMVSNSSLTGDSTLTITQPANGVGATTTLRMSPAGGTAAMRLTTLTLSSSAKLDLSDNKLVVAGGDVGSWNGSVYTGITGLVDSGRGNGSWSGDGIVTSMSDATSGLLTTLAVALAQDVGYAGGTFAGVSVASGDVLVMYTWGGDAELDGDLDGDDYFWIDSNVGNSGNVFGFNKGDFDYDGDIDGDDYFIIDSNIAFAQLQPPWPTSVESLSVVPEPASSWLLSVGTVTYLIRRRRLNGR